MTGMSRVMEYLAGETLATRLARSRPLPPLTAARRLATELDDVPPSRRTAP